MASVDSLSIQITASATSATRRVNELCDALNRLVGAIAQLDTSKFADLSGNVNNLSQGLTSLKGAGVKQVEKVAQALNNVSTEGNVFEPIAQGAAQMAQEAQVATQNTNKMAEAVNTLDATPLTDVSGALQTVDASLNNTSTRMTGFRALLANLRIIVPTDGLRTIDKEIDKLQAKISELRERMNFKATNNRYIDDKEMQRDQVAIQGLITELDRLMLKRQELESHGGFRLNASAFGFADFSRHVQNANARIDTFISRMSRTRSATRGATRSTKEFSLSATKLASEIFRVSKMLKLMVTRMALRAVIREVGNGFKSLALHSEEFDNAMSGIINSSKKLAYSFSGMVGPLISALAPALTYVIGLLTKFLNLLNQLFSALSGKSTFAKAKDFTGKWSDSIKDANDNAKELKKTLLGFDEINQLQDNSKSSSGSGNNDIVDMYEDVEIDKNLQDLASKIKKIFDQIMTPIKKAWAKMGDFVVNSWKKAFQNVKKLLEDVGRDFLEVWNQEATVKMLEKIFHIIGNIGNVVGNLAKQFDKAWEKNKVGLHILEKIRDIFDIIITHIDNAIQATVDWAATLDFSPLLEAIDNWLEIFIPVVNAIAGVLEDFYTTVILPVTKWVVEEGVPGLIKVFQDFNDAVKWDVLRERLKTLWEHVEPFMETVGEGLIIFINDVAQALAGFINSQTFENFLIAVENFMDSVEPQDVANGLKAICVALLGYRALATIMWIFTGVSAFISGLGRIAATIRSVAATITGALTSVTEFMTSPGWLTFTEFLRNPASVVTLSSLIDFVRGTWLDPDEWTGLFGRIYDYVGIVWNNLWTIIGSPFTGFDSEEFEKSWQSIEKYNEAIEKLEANGKSTAGTYDEIMRRVQLLDEELKGQTKSVNETAGAVDGLGNSAKSASNTATSSFESAQKSGQAMSDGLKKSFEGVSAGAANLGKDTKVEFDNMELEVANSQLAMSGTLQTLSKDVSDCGEDMISTADDIKGAFDEKEWTLDGIAKGLTKSFEEAKKGIKGVWNSIAEKLNGEYEIGHTKFNIKLPKFFAKGGFPEDGFFFANSTELVGRFDNGKTAVANNEQIVEGIRQGVYEAVSMAMSTSQGGGDKNVYTTIQIDGETIARAVTKGQNSIGRRYSPTMS